MALTNDKLDQMERDCAVAWDLILSKYEENEARFYKTLLRVAGSIPVDSKESAFVAMALAYVGMKLTWAMAEKERDV